MAVPLHPDASGTIGPLVVGTKDGWVLATGEPTALVAAPLGMRWDIQRGVAIGLVLLIVPGIIFAVIFGFYGWGLVDGVVDDGVSALRHSAEITRGHRWQLFGFAIVLILFNLLGLLALVVGVLITSAVSILALAHVYRQLAGGAPTPA